MSDKCRHGAPNSRACYECGYNSRNKEVKILRAKNSLLNRKLADVSQARDNWRRAWADESLLSEAMNAKYGAARRAAKAWKEKAREYRLTLNNYSKLRDAITRSGSMYRRMKRNPKPLRQPFYDLEED